MNVEENERDKEKVAVGWLFPDKVSGWFMLSMVDMLQFDAGYKHRFLGEGGFMCLSTGPRVAEARNQLIDQFAKSYPDADWLFMVDSDMTFEPTLIEELLAVADPKERPVVGALAFGASGDSGGPFPTIYREIEVEGEDGEPAGIIIDVVKDYPLNSLVKVGATGGAGLLIHKGVLAAMAQPWPKGFGTLQDGRPNPYPWFSEGLVDAYNKPLGEDVAFCRRLRMMGIPLHVHTGIKLGHIKNYKLDEAYFLEHRDDTKPAVGSYRRKEEPEPSTPNRAARRAAARNRGGDA